MATIPCPCCRVEISADRPLCVECGDPSGGSYFITYSLRDWERERIPDTCPHRGRAPFPKNLLPWHGHRYGCLCSVTGVIEEDEHADLL